VLPSLCQLDPISTINRFSGRGMGFLHVIKHVSKSVIQLTVCLLFPRELKRNLNRPTWILVNGGCTSIRYMNRNLTNAANSRIFATSSSVRLSEISLTSRASLSCCRSNSSCSPEGTVPAAKPTVMLPEDCSLLWYKESSDWRVSLLNGTIQEVAHDQSLYVHSTGYPWGFDLQARYTVHVSHRLHGNKTTSLLSRLNIRDLTCPLQLSVYLFLPFGSRGHYEI
jgi:hypothetical protein